MPETWQELAIRATYAKLRTNDHTVKRWGAGNYHLLVGYTGKIENRDQITRSPDPRFSINWAFRPQGEPIPPCTSHLWVVADDTIDYYDQNGAYIGTYPPQRTTKESFTEEASKLFKAGTAKAKGGYRAIVEYNGTVVWEGDQVYKDDDNYVEADYDNEIKQVGTSGLTKAQKAADSAVEQAVETLFAKVKA